MSQRAYARITYVTLFAAVGAMAPYLPVYFRSLGLNLDAVGFLGALLGLQPRWWASHGQ